MTEVERKNQTVRVALAVFLGVLAALIVSQIPGWYKKHQAANAEEKQDEIDSRLREMKPMEFAARCGKLIEDKTIDEGTGMASRDVTVEITMPDGMKKKVTAEWMTVQAAEDYDPSVWILDNVDGLDPSSDALRPIIESNYACTVKSTDTSSSLEFVTAKEVISACGRPLKDKTSDDGTTIRRYLTFETVVPGENKKKVTAVFSGFGAPGTPPDFTLDYFGGLSVVDDSEAIIEQWYPCLKSVRTNGP